MSLEQTVTELTAAIREQTLVLREVLSAGFSTTPVAIPQEAPKAEKVKESKKPKKVEPEAAPVEEEVEEEEIPEPESELDDSVVALPAGTRDHGYYLTHVQPVMMELSQAGDQAEHVRAILASYGVRKASEIPSKKWDEVVAKSKAVLSALASGDDDLI